MNLKMNKKDVLNFAPEGEKRRRSVPGYVKVIVFLCIAAFIGSVFIILAVNDFDIGKALGAREAEEEITEEETTAQANETLLDTALTDAVTFLLICSEEKELTFCQLVSVDVKANKIRIKPIPPDYTLETSSGPESVAEIFKSRSKSVFAASFSSRNINIKKYVHITEDNFKRLMAKMGTVPVEIGGYYEFNVDAVRYTFEPGVQNMTSDMLLKYMKFAEEGEAKLRLQGHAVADVFRQHFTNENYSKGEELFSELINLVDTNITAFDYNAAAGILSLMLSGDTEIAVVS